MRWQATADEEDDEDANGAGWAFSGENNTAVPWALDELMDVDDGKGDDTELEPVNVSPVRRGVMFFQSDLRLSYRNWLG